jgi:hypothetical protein
MVDIINIFIFCYFTNAFEHEIGLSSDNDKKAMLYAIIPWFPAVILYWIFFKNGYVTVKNEKKRKQCKKVKVHTILNSKIRDFL